MLTKEEYKRELVRMWDSVRDDKHKGKAMCEGVICKDCRLYDTDCEKQINAFRMIEIIKKWSKENPPKKYKVSQLEYDILKSFIDDTKFVYYFYDSDLLMSLLKKGYFQGSNNDTDIYEYIENCVIKGEK